MAPPDSPFGLALLALLLAITVIDVRRQIIPDALNLLLAALGLFYQAAMLNAFPAAAVAAGIAVMIALWGLRAGFRYYRGVVGLGLGDVKMAGAAATWIDPWNLPLFLMAACLSALLFVAYMAAAGRAPDWGTRIPFGPFIAAGLMLTWLLERSGLPTLVPYGG